VLKRAEIEKEDLERRLDKTTNELNEIRDILQDREATVGDLESRLEQVDYAYRELQTVM
jgi:hypothetical protein